MVDDAVVGLRGAAKRYRWGGHWVLRDVDVDVALAPGRIVEVRGTNGSGKSTLLRLLARGWHVVSYTEGRGDTPARIRARRP